MSPSNLNRSYENENGQVQSTKVHFTNCLVKQCNIKVKYSDCLCSRVSVLFENTKN